MFQVVPTRSDDDPCIMYADTHRPVSVEYVRKKWAQHLHRHGVETASLSLHSLRKAAATEAHSQGCPELDIQRYGV